MGSKPPLQVLHIWVDVAGHEHGPQPHPCQRGPQLVPHPLPGGQTHAVGDGLLRTETLVGGHEGGVANRVLTRPLL